MIKYQTRWHGSTMAEIKALEILRETEKQVVLPPTHPKGKESRENKISDWQCWFDTWEQAHDFLVSEAQKKVDSLRLDLQKANGSLGNIKGMKHNVGGKRAHDALGRKEPCRSALRLSVKLERILLRRQKWNYCQKHTGRRIK